MTHINSYAIKGNNDVETFISLNENRKLQQNTVLMPPTNLLYTKQKYNDQSLIS